MASPDGPLFNMTHDEVMKALDGPCNCGQPDCHDMVQRCPNPSCVDAPYNAVIFNTRPEIALICQKCECIFMSFRLVKSAHN